jgi:TetR/AcrR family transcriptional regulator, mexJK operon transcriptional repressor
MAVLADRDRPPGVGGMAGGSGPKGEAIAQAALRLFISDGYERTSVDAIAAEAGVSKRTIYNRYGDKRNLLMSVMKDAYATVLSAFAAIMDAHLDNMTDLEQDLTAFAREAAFTVIRRPERAALIRLMMTEAPHFPELLRLEMGPLTIIQGLTRHLSALAPVWGLDITEPREAAEQLFALTFGRINNRTMFGTMPIGDEEIERIVGNGIRLFVRAYRSPAGPRDPQAFE